MSVRSVYLYEPDFEMLKFLIEFFEEQQGAEFGGKSFMWT
jgi:hypothetical protein